MLGQKAIFFAEQFLFHTRPINRICNIGKNSIKDYKDYIFIDLLSSDESDEIYEFNFMTFDRNNLSKWERRNRFLETAEKFVKENKWEDSGSYQYLNNLIKTISFPSE